MTLQTRTRALVIGSGAGGAVTAHELAASGIDVTILEEGDRHELDDYGHPAPKAMASLYRRRGMTPFVGRVPIGFVEGCCVGGSTEINSGFWHRTPADVLFDWRRRFALEDADPDAMAPHFAWAERHLEVAKWSRDLPKSTKLLLDGADRLGWSAGVVPRAAARCASTNACASGCPTGAKQGVSRNLLPAAEALGARLVSNCRVDRLLIAGDRANGATAMVRRADGTVARERFHADHVFLCAGATQTPSVLRRSGIKKNVGDTILVHPMLKVVARFRQIVDAHRTVLPLVQVTEFWPDIVLGGAFCSPGHVALALSDNWRDNAQHMASLRYVAAYYVGIRSVGHGRVRPAWISDGTSLRYELADTDLSNLRKGLDRLVELLFAAGAVEIYPGISGLPALRDARNASLQIGQSLSPKTVSLTAVHAFASCPMGGRARSSAADPYGRLHGMANLRVNDASMLPGSPGVNPQGTVMAFARRNVHRFLESVR